MEKVLSYSRPKLRDYFEAFLCGQKVGAEENKVFMGGDSFESPAELKGSSLRTEIRIKTESSDNDAASNPGFSGVCIKTEKPDEGNIRIKTEKLDTDEVGETYQPTSCGSLIPDRSLVNKEKEDRVAVKTEENDICIKDEGRLEENHLDNFRGGPLVQSVKTEEGDIIEFDIKRVKTEQVSDANTVTCQQIVREYRDSQIKEEEEVVGSPHVQNNDDASNGSRCSPNPPTTSIEEEMNSNDKMKELCGESNVLDRLDGSHSIDLEYTHRRSCERKAKQLAKMMLKKLEENVDFVDRVNGNKRRSRGFMSLQSSPPLKLHEMNNDFVKFKSAFNLQECSVKIQRLSEELLDHYRVSLDDVPVDEKVDVQTLKRGLFSCSECSFRTHHIKELRDHRWKHRTDTAYHQCRECNYRTKWLPGIVSHVKRVHRQIKPYECPHCDYKCACSTALKQHVNIHTSNKPYKCPYCNYRCVAQASLRSHVYTHTGEKPYACPHCSYRCTQYPHLKSHLYVHTKEKPYACELCEYKTTQSTHLRSHMQVMHTNVKPFKCQHCSYASKSLTGLRIHVRKHTGERPYACVLCSYKATQSTSLRVHMRGHLEKRRCKCQVCGYSSHTPFSMKNHIALCHE